MLLESLLLAAALGNGTPDPSRAELSRVAGRIEELKQRRLAGQDVGRELERLLVRAQELASQIERYQALAEAAPPEVVATPAELRERADALRDEADTASAELAALVIRLEALRRSSTPAPGVASAAVSRGRGGEDDERLRALLAERQRVADRLAALRAEAAALEAAADALERGEAR